jgi:hypothetical protein
MEVEQKNLWYRMIGLFQQIFRLIHEVLAVLMLLFVNNFIYVIHP